MQIVSNGDNLHEMSNPVFSGNKKNVSSLSSAELAQRVVKVNSLPNFYLSQNLSFLLLAEVPKKLLAAWHAYSVYPDQMQPSAASDLVVHCSLRPFCPNT